MLFNTYAFVFGFLPLVLAGVFAARRWAGPRAAMALLTLASLGFYAWWNPVYLALLLPSLVLNYALAGAIQRAPTPRRRWWLAAGGIAANLGVLAYFKYADFFLANARTAFGLDVALLHVVLPLGISFITFQKIAYLADAHAGKPDDRSFTSFALFVAFFPQLIAGPIVHHADLIPQFRRDEAFRSRADHLAIGLTVFAAGLFKKVVLADQVAPIADAVFGAAAAGQPLTFLEAWGGALAYSLQLYFDFAGYSDMALGLAFMFGIRLPLNFDSPYQARSLIDFWRRWHMTLSRFLRDYLYIPLGGNRKGPARRYAHVLATMALGGLWHGAGWTFVIWGLFHGGCLMANHAWRDLQARLGVVPRAGGAGSLAAWALTLLVVVVGWVYFRAPDVGVAHQVLGAMAGGNGLALPPRLAPLLGPAAELLRDAGVRFEPLARFPLEEDLPWVLGLGAIALFAPNVHRVMGAWSPALEARDAGAPAPRWWQWKPTVGWAVASACAAIGAILGFTQVSAFLYFQF